MASVFPLFSLITYIILRAIPLLSPPLRYLFLLHLFSDLLITLLFWYFYIPYFANLWCSQPFRPPPPHLSFHRALLGLSNFKLRTRYYPPLEQPRQDQAREPPPRTTPTHPARSSSSILLSHDDQECQLMCWHPNNHTPCLPLLLLLRWCSCWPQSVLLVHFSASHTTPHTGMYTTILCHTIRLIHSKPPHSFACCSGIRTGAWPGPTPLASPGDASIAKGTPRSLHLMTGCQHLYPLGCIFMQVHHGIMAALARARARK